MTNSVESTLSLLASVSDSLNKASDFLSTRISEVESALARYKLGVRAWVRVSSQEATDGFLEVRDLGYGKHEGKWSLLVAEYYDHDLDDARARFSRLRSMFIRDSIRSFVYEAEAKPIKRFSISVSLHAACVSRCPLCDSTLEVRIGNGWQECPAIFHRLIS